MNVEEFLSSFGHMANSPGGVARLRGLVFHFAVSGKLVPYISSEGHAEDALAEAAAAKKRYRERLKLRPSYGEKDLSGSDEAYRLPEHWKWERLGNVACYIQRGKGPKYDTKGKTLVVSQKCIQWGGFDLSVARRVSDDSQNNYGPERFLVKGDILWNSTGTGTAGRTILFPGANQQVVADSHVTVVRLTNFVPAYIRCFLASPLVQRMMQPGQEDSMVTGTTNQVELSTNKVFQLPVPCPPVKEQKRIVAKVDELMALCDQLETQQQERERRFPVLSRTCHARFVETPTPANLNRIFDETGAVSPDDLRKTILTLAVQGKLTPQDQRREETILVSMEDLVGKKNLKNGLSLSPVAGPSDFGCLPLSAMQGSVIDCSETKPISITADRAAPYLIKERDVFIIRGNGNKDRVGIAGMVHSTPSNVLFPDLFIRVPLPEDRIDGHYFLIAWNSRVTRKILEGLATTTAGIWKVNQGHISECKIPIPPLAEQRRIVAKVDELMTLVVQLEAQQQERDKLAEAFAKACVASFTGTTQLERPEKMKAPKTELVSLVSLGKMPKPSAKAPLATLLSQNKGILPAKSLWQQSGMNIDDFYQQLRTEIAAGWIAEPKSEDAYMNELLSK